MPKQIKTPVDLQKKKENLNLMLLDATQMHIKMPDLMNF